MLRQFTVVDKRVVEVLCDKIFLDERIAFVKPILIFDFKGNEIKNHQSVLFICFLRESFWHVGSDMGPALEKQRWGTETRFEGFCTYRTYFALDFYWIKRRFICLIHNTMTDSFILDSPEFDCQFNQHVDALMSAKCFPVTESEITETLEIVLDKLRPADTVSAGLE